jgi:hypothetical protein
VALERCTVAYDKLLIATRDGLFRDVTAGKLTLQIMPNDGQILINPFLVLCHCHRVQNIPLPLVSLNQEGSKPTSKFSRAEWVLWELAYNISTSP